MVENAKGYEQECRSSGWSETYDMMLTIMMAGFCWRNWAGIIYRVAWMISLKCLSREIGLRWVYLNITFFWWSMQILQTIILIDFFFCRGC